jgi:DNA (cytosine-5)-methyltransferase 1
LFSGAGGLSLGFKMAKFHIGLSLESEKNYVETYKRNNPECLCLNEDITSINYEKVKDKYIKNEKIEGIIGGPPCQGFSTVGDRKKSDPRNTLIYFFIKWVECFKPSFYVMENVPGILTMAQGQVVKEIKKLYENIGYTCVVKSLLSADYGVPQLRERVFFMGTKDESIGSLNIKKINRDDDKQKTLFESDSLPPYLTVNDALSDILEIEPFVENFNDDFSKDYIYSPKTKYQEYLRNDSEKLYDHFAPNHGKTLIERISHINQGENHSFLPEKYKLKSGYPNIYGRLHLNTPADTITGNCGCVSAPGRFIHPTQNRALSVREAARLQSFPDNYRFLGSMRDKYKQVGNAVPPLMALAVAEAIKKVFL